jgi:DNA-binding PucR family transcriptional regulator
MPIDTMLRAYSVSHSAFFEHWTRTVHSLLDDPVEVAEAVEEGARWTFAFVHAMMHGIVKRYAVERERWVRSAAAVRLEVAQAILRGEEVDVESAGRRLGYALNRDHLAFVVWIEGEEGGGDDLGRLERAASGLAETRGAGRALLVPFGTQLVAGWIGSFGSIDDSPLTFGDLDPPAAEARAAVGTPGSGIEGFRRSHREAMYAYRLAIQAPPRPGTVTAYRDVALTALASADLEQARHFVARELGPLAADDDYTVTLAATLRVYLEERSSPRRAAQRLGVHENTIVKRIHSARELLDRPIETRTSELLVGLRLAPLVRAADAKRSDSR